MPGSASMFAAQAQVYFDQQLEAYRSKQLLREGRLACAQLYRALNQHQSMLSGCHHSVT